MGHVLHPVVFRPFLFRHWILRPGGYFGFGLLMWLVMLALFLGLLILVVMLLRRDRRHGPAAMPPRPPSLGILEERYARGEMSRDDFIERRQVLMGWGPEDSTTPMPPPPSGSA